MSGAPPNSAQQSTRRARGPALTRLLCREHARRLSCHVGPAARLSARSVRRTDRRGMRKLCFTTLGAILWISCSSTGAQSAEATIQSLEEVWNQSRIAGDARQVANLLDDDWKLTHVDGRVEGKEPYVRDIASGGRQIQSIEVHERTIRIFGQVAIVTGEALQRGYRRGELRIGRLRFTHVWVRQNTTWRMLFSQSTEIKSAD